MKKKRLLLQILIGILGAASILIPTLIAYFVFGEEVSYITSVVIVAAQIAVIFFLAARNKEEFFK